MSTSVLDYLTNVLSQRGPTAVPYDETVKWNIRDHVSELQKVFPTLTSKLSEYHSNDGRLLHVLKVEGTMPIHYQGAKYNIPILMWLTEKYPFAAPAVYVVPTANMVIRSGNFVNASGQVSTPLLRMWLFPSSNLVDTVLEMTQHFGREPPLYTRPAGYTPPPVAYPPQGYPQSTPTSSNGYPGMGYPPPTGMTPYATPSSTPGNTGPPSSTGWLANSAGGGPYAAPAGALPPPPPQPPPPPPPGGFGFGGIFGGLFGGGGGQQQPPQPPPQQSQPPPPPRPPPGSVSGGPSSNQLAVEATAAAVAAEPPRPPSVTRTELEVHFRHLAIEALSAQLRALQHSFSEFAADETVKALEVQNQLSERRAQLQTAHDALTKERMGTEQLVSELACKTKALQGWLDRNEPRSAGFDPATGSVSSHLLPADELSRQGMETQARDLALEDAILALDKLLQTGQVPLDVYLKQVRALCRKQFFSRALGLKVAAVQQSRPHPVHPPHQPAMPPYPLAHADGWSHGLSPPPPSEPPGAGPGGPGSGVVAATNPLVGR